MGKWIRVIPFAAAAVIIGLIQTVLLANERIKPYPNPFGRATVLAHPATAAETVQMLGEGAFAYRSGDSLVMVTTDAEGNAAETTRPLPAPGLFSDAQLTADSAVWIGDGGKLYGAEWSGSAWSAMRLLAEGGGMKGLSAVGGGVPGSDRVLLRYDEQALYAGVYRKGAEVTWSKLDLPNISSLAAASDPTDGGVGVVYATEHNGRVSLGFVKLAARSLQPVLQSKLKEVELASYNRLEHIAVGSDRSVWTAAYTISSSKSGKSYARLLTFPGDRPQAAEEIRLDLPVKRDAAVPAGSAAVPAGTSDAATGADVSDTVLHPAFVANPPGTSELVVSSVYVKNRRLTSQEVYRIGLTGGKPQLPAALVSHSAGFADYPALAYDGQGHALAVWLEPKGDDSYLVHYTSNLEPYRTRTDKLTGADYQRSAETLPLLWGIALLTALLSLKWIVLPAAYLLVLYTLREAHYDNHPALHFGISLGLYLASKLVLLGDYRKPQALELMPPAVQSVAAHLAIVALIAVLAYVSTKLLHRDADYRNAGLELLYFVALDIWMTNLWFAYFMSPASL
ncbi:hypothetical protein SD70_17570 [Gordoniibacillus kamchatkensis]|uniref:Uncharacterized protein n=1 Tax=Gordoniibacillus kamchatkensis TaxID=1590651 RepID=A0ABR5AFN5_9BACL|nr:hypothetical protein [Paenibacillus sp. VKM B-2647]KIL39868.1 hypothetical protein SD70_17570 [Paenibacillus sp. VKM B-2647]